jgi:hypothetical protein
MTGPRLYKGLAIGAACAVAGAVAGIAGSAAAPAHKAATNAAGTTPPPGFRHGFGGPDGMRGPGGDAVHEVEVVPTASGTFITVTRDNGTVVSTTSSSITLKEGTSTATYATPTIDIPSSAKVMLDGKTTTLDKLAAGDRVSVSQSSQGVEVFATDSSFTPPGHPGGPMGGPAGGPPPGYGG